MVVPSSSLLLGLGQLFYSDVFISFALECRLSLWNFFREVIKQRSWAKFLHHRHDHHFITRVFHLQNNLIEALDIVFQALAIFLVNCEEVRGIRLPALTAHEIGNKEPAQVAKRVNGSWRHLSEPCSRWTLQGRWEGFAHHLVWVSLKRHQVLVWVQVVYWIDLPFVHSELRWQFKLGGYSGPHHPFYEW